MGVGPFTIGDWLSPNFAAANRGAGDIQGIVLHDTESASAAALAWLTNRASGVSAHYVIAEAGGIYRLVYPRNIAFHVAAFGNDPRLNRNRPAWLPAYNGRHSAVNAATIGIELAGFAATGYQPAQYQALGLLCAQLCQEYAIPPTLLPEYGAEAAILTHGWLQTDRSDPGPLFSWALFAHHLNAYLGDTDVARIEELEAHIRHLDSVNTILQAERDYKDALLVAANSELGALKAHELEPLKARVAELEAALAGQQPAAERKATQIVYDNATTQEIAA
jgi:N-acetyl-anhydromuramyl-L-alanine amidase AmpD